ncbi:hypothetical protein Mapa_001726 [Marchantia paleacea]|nr:hypothetical protein Mapa_001726 [Marchantia paleacea]
MRFHSHIPLASRDQIRYRKHAELLKTFECTLRPSHEGTRPDDTVEPFADRQSLFLAGSRHDPDPASCTDWGYSQLVQKQQTSMRISPAQTFSWVHMPAVLSGSLWTRSSRPTFETLVGRLC